MTVTELRHILSFAGPNDEVFLGANAAPLVDVDIITDPILDIDPFVVLLAEAIGGGKWPASHGSTR